LESKEGVGVRADSGFGGTALLDCKRYTTAATTIEQTMPIKDMVENWNFLDEAACFASAPAGKLFLSFKLLVAGGIATQSHRQKVVSTCLRFGAGGFPFCSHAVWA
jgi:hypothetical protein